NTGDGVFDAADESLGRVLLAQCAVAMQRTLMMEKLIEGEKLRQQLETARIVQMSTLPAAMPYLPGYEVCGTFKLVDLTGDDIFEQRNSAGEEYGEARVKAVIARNNRQATADIVAELFAAIAAFAGEKQDDDMTVVLVKRAGPVATRSFKRSFDELAAIFAFTRENMNAEIARTVDFVLEELFTNIVKYGARSEAPVHIDIVRVAGGAEVTIIDTDAEPFDIMAAPEADVNLPIEERKPGGLGIHLIRKMVDTIQYSYVAEQRTSRITFRQTEKINVDD